MGNACECSLKSRIGEVRRPLYYPQPDRLSMASLHDARGFMLLIHLFQQFQVVQRPSTHYLST